MKIRAMIVFGRRVSIFLLIIVILALQASYYLFTNSLTVKDHAPVSAEVVPPHLPSIYLTSNGDTKECERKYGSQYLYDAAATRRPYCEARYSLSELFCFQAKVAKGRADPFCLASQAILSPTSRKFELDCQLREWDTPDLQGSPKVEEFKEDWYATGPGYVFKKHIGIGKKNTEQVKECHVQNSTTSASHTILVKREGGYNLWHSLMEIFSYTLTIDALHLSRNDNADRPLFESIDAENTQVVILDEIELGPYIELWHLLAKRPIKRLNDILKSESPCFTNIIVPLSGATNPLWQGDWAPLDCTYSKTLSVFVDRILDLFSISRERDPSAPLVVTFIDRKGSRRLLNQDNLLSHLRSTYSNIVINVVDFAAITFREQLSMVWNTDVLVGVHGAGLTHAIFLCPKSSVVEILPANVQHKGFRNLARLRGHQYFSTHCTHNDAEYQDDWHRADVVLEESRFSALMEVAIKSMHHRGLLDLDVR